MRIRTLIIVLILAVLYILFLTFQLIKSFPDNLLISRMTKPFSYSYMSMKVKTEELKDKHKFTSFVTQSKLRDNEMKDQINNMNSKLVSNSMNLQTNKQSIDSSLLSETNNLKVNENSDHKLSTSLTMFNSSITSYEMLLNITALSTNLYTDINPLEKSNKNTLSEVTVDAKGSKKKVVKRPTKADLKKEELFELEKRKKLQIYIYPYLNSKNNRLSSLTLNKDTFYSSLPFKLPSDKTIFVTKTHIPHYYIYNDQHQVVKPLLMLATSFINTNSKRKLCIQNNTYHNIASLSPYVGLVIFDNTNSFKDIETKYNNIFVTDQFISSPFKTPFFSSILYTLEQSIESSFYGFINGDILIPPSVQELLHFIQEQQQKQTLQKKIMIVGRRTNVKVYPYTKIPFQNITNQNMFFDTIMSTNEQFITVAQDFFIFPPNTIPYTELQPIVIGRNGYDNYLVTYFYNRTDTDLIDVSDGLPVIHQTDSHGNWAGGRETLDKPWNLVVTEDLINVGSTSMANYLLSRFIDNSYHMISGNMYDDNYSREELEFISRYVPKQAKDCIYYTNGNIQGTLRDIECKKIDVLVWDIHMARFQINLPKSKFKIFRRNIKVQNNHLAKSECSNFKAYLNLPKYRLMNYDFIFIDSICQAQAAVALYDKLVNPLATIVIRNTRLLKNKYLSIITQLYKPIDELPPFQQSKYELYTGMAAYQKITNRTFIPPSWWM